MKNIFYFKKLLLSLGFFIFFFYNNLISQPYDIIWRNFINTTASGNTLTKIGGHSDWSTGGAISANVIPANTDGWTEFTVTEKINLMVGLSTPNNIAYFGSIKYAAHINPTRFYVFENGDFKKELVGYNIGDVFRVERIGNTIYYKRNGVIFYTSLIPSTEELITDASIYDEGHSVYGAKSSHPLAVYFKDVFPYQESFEQGFGDWVEELSSGIWTHNSGNTPSMGTGPSFAFDGNSYIYMEASTPNNPNKIAILKGPPIDLTDIAIANFQFQYHMWGTQVGTLKLEVTADGGASWNSVWSKSGDQDDYWKRAEVDLNAYLGQTIQLRFYGQTGSGSSSDMGIDDLFLSTINYVYTVPCTTTVDDFPYQESFEFGQGNWTKKGRYEAWTRRSGQSNPLLPDTGPSFASDGSYYCFANSAFSFPVLSTLESPCFDLSNENSAFFNFDHHMLGPDVGTLNLEVSTDEGINWILVWGKTGNQGDIWFNNNVDLSAYTGQTIRLRFRARTKPLTSDIAIDKLELTTTPPPGSTGCTTLITDFPYQESFESDFGDWETPGLPNIWRRNSGGTPTHNTGPGSAQDGIYYLYTEVSDPAHPQRIDYLEGPCFDFGDATSASFHFLYHMWGAGIGRLDLQISTNSGAGWSNIWTKQLDQGNTWHSAEVDLTNYIGQTIKLRFKSRKKILGANKDIGDIAVDGFNLYAETTEYGNLQGTIDFPIQDGNCGEDSPTSKVPNVQILLKNNNINITASNSDGVFVQTMGFDDTNVKLEPSVSSGVWANGVSVFDANLVNSHINGLQLIDCPYRRLAADVDGDGDLDNDDVLLIQALAVENIVNVPNVPNWKFIAKSYCNSTDLNPDARFVADFWNVEVGDDYPFNSSLRANGKTYTYNHGPQNESWMNILNPTTFDPNSTCTGNDWGFYIVKTGDVNGNANFLGFPSLPPFEPSDPNLPVPDSPEQEVLPINLLENDGNSSLNVYEVRVVLNTTEKIVAYQLDFFFNDELIELGPISPNTEYLNQTESQNYGPAIKTSEGASFKTVWLTDLSSHPEGVNIAGQEESTGVDGVTLFSFEFSSYEPLEHVRYAVQIETAHLEPIFYSKDGPIEEVDLQIFIEEK